MAKKKKEVKANAIDRNEFLKGVQETFLKVKDVELKEILPNVIDDVIITMNDGTQNLHIPDNMVGEKFKKWLRGRGGILSKDATRLSKGKEYGKYVLLKDTETTTIVRLIEDNELESFSFLKLIHGKIKDKPFMILKTIKNSESLTRFDRYIEENVETMNLDVKIVENTNIPSPSDEGHYSSHNLLEE